MKDLDKEQVLLLDSLEAQSNLLEKELSKLSGRLAGEMGLSKMNFEDLVPQLDDDEAATCIAADVMQHLWRPIPPEHPFPTVHR